MEDRTFAARGGKRWTQAVRQRAPVVGTHDQEGAAHAGAPHRTWAGAEVSCCGILGLPVKTAWHWLSLGQGNTTPHERVHRRCHGAREGWRPALPSCAHLTMRGGFTPLMETPVIACSGHTPNSRPPEAPPPTSVPRAASAACHHTVSLFAHHLRLTVCIAVLRFWRGDYQIPLRKPCIPRGSRAQRRTS